VTRLGQHFLTDPHLLQRIAQALDPAPTDVVVEIGPGTGTLTRVLAPQVARVIAIERDRRLADGLISSVPGNVTVVTGDALRPDWHDLVGGLARFKVIGNIPYAITSPLITKALVPPRPGRVVFLVQREVADRLVAKPGTRAYGALSIGVQATCHVEQVLRVEPGAFRPRPRVQSALVRLVPRDEPLVAADEERAFRTFVTACFSRRRKQVSNAVQAATGADRASVVRLLEGLGIDPRVRPETLAPEAFARLLRSVRSL
jgi:16S rRNA (adenine1518-N6/adenine1519-N6)-dimethyltransferase